MKPAPPKPNNLVNTGKAAWQLVNWFRSGYSGYIDRLENSSRVKEFERAYNKGISEGMTDFEAQNHAAFQARDLMDYAQMSEFMYVVNQLYFFSNASLRGILRTFGDWKHKPSRQIDAFGDDFSVWAIAFIYVYGYGRR